MYQNDIVYFYLVYRPVTKGIRLMMMHKNSYLSFMNKWIQEEL